MVSNFKIKGQIAELERKNKELKKLIIFLAEWVIGGFYYLSDPTSRSSSAMNAPEIPEELQNSTDEDIRKLLEKIGF